MYDLRTYIATQDDLGGPVYLEEHFSPLNQGYVDNSDDGDRLLTLGRVIGGVISLALIIGTGTYLFLAL